MAVADFAPEVDGTMTVTGAIAVEESLVNGVHHLIEVETEIRTITALEDMMTEIDLCPHRRHAIETKSGTAMTIHQVNVDGIKTQSQIM